MTKSPHDFYDGVGFWADPVLWKIKHQFYDCLRFIGFRDRLRCPSIYCNAVGTWKPHGGWFDTKDERGVRRWLCKWCGEYDGPDKWDAPHIDGEKWAVPDRDSNVWTLINIRGPIPTHRLPKWRFENEVFDLDPWVG